MFLKNGRIRSALGGRVMEKPLATQAVNRSKILALLGEDTANARYTAATRPITDCQKNLVLADSPFGLRSHHLAVVVDPADRAEAQRHHQHDPDESGWTGRPTAAW